LQNTCGGNESFLFKKGFCAVKYANIIFALTFDAAGKLVCLSRSERISLGIWIRSGLTLKGISEQARRWCMSKNREYSSSPH
jgi:hypothetical protein